MPSKPVAWRGHPHCYSRPLTYVTPGRKSLAENETRVKWTKSSNLPEKQQARGIRTIMEDLMASQRSAPFTGPPLPHPKQIAPHFLTKLTSDDHIEVFLYTVETTVKQEFWNKEEWDRNLGPDFDR
ncbi:hypothetical protein MHYP_G00148040 [Metynnis hypsauchen]